MFVHRQACARRAEERRRAEKSGAARRGEESEYISLCNNTCWISMIMAALIAVAGAERVKAL